MMMVRETITGRNLGLEERPEGWRLRIFIGKTKILKCEIGSAEAKS